MIYSKKKKEKKESPQLKFLREEREAEWALQHSKRGTRTLDGKVFEKMKKKYGIKPKKDS